MLNVFLLPVLHTKHLQEQEKIKLLLLGAGESGKSTIFKQMKLLYGAGNTLEDKKMMTPVVYSNTIAAMRVLIDQAKHFGLDVEVRRRRGWRQF